MAASPSQRSNASGAPPSAQGQQVSAEQLQQTHPLWARSRGQPLPTPTGRGGGAGGGMRGPGRGSGGSNNGDAPRFEPLSAYTLELESFRRNADGDSALFSDRSETLARAPRRRKRSQPEEDDDDDDDDDDGGFSALIGSEDEHESGGEDEDGPQRGESKKKSKKKKKPNQGGGEASMFAQAAFGGNYGASSACSDADSASQLSGTSSTRRKQAYKATFPVKGIDCVGCALVKKIAPVEKFIKDYMDKMSEEALWKMAALTYVREVQEPRKREGVLSPDWSWKDVRTHFLLHCSDNHIARTFTVKSIQTARYAVEQRLMRVTDGQRELDKAGAELMLKLIKEESAQRQMLASSSGGGKKQPGGSTVGDAK